MKHLPAYKGLAVLNSEGEARWTGEIRLNEKVLEDPLHWKKPRMIFVSQMSDLFHEKAPDEWIDRVFAVMALCPQHVFQVLTKRPERMQEYLKSVSILGNRQPDFLWPLRNVWLGVSTEDRPTFDERVTELRKVPAAVRWISYEPALGPLGDVDLTGISWVVCGGESGPGARPMNLQWARDVRDQCKAAGVAFFMKQICDARGHKIPFAKFPKDLQVREYPDAK